MGFTLHIFIRVIVDYSLCATFETTPLRGRSEVPRLPYKCLSLLRFVYSCIAGPVPSASFGNWLSHRVGIGLFAELNYYCMLVVELLSAAMSSCITGSSGAFNVVFISTASSLCAYLIAWHRASPVEWGISLGGDWDRQKWQYCPSRYTLLKIMSWLNMIADFCCKCWGCCCNFCMVVGIDRWYGAVSWNYYIGGDIFDSMLLAWRPLRSLLFPHPTSVFLLSGPGLEFCKSTWNFVNDVACCTKSLQLAIFFEPQYASILLRMDSSKPSIKVPLSTNS